MATKVNVVVQWADGDEDDFDAYDVVGEDECEAALEHGFLLLSAKPEDDGSSYVIVNLAQARMVVIHDLSGPVTPEPQDHIPFIAG